MLLSFVKMGLVYPEKPQKPRRVRAAHGAKNFNYFLPRHVRGKKYFSAQQVPKARSGPQTFWQQNRKILRQFLIWYRRHGRRVTGVEENTACQGQRRQQQIGNPQQDGQQIPQQLATR